MKNVTKIALRGQVYAAPKTEIVEIENQGVLCGSGQADDFGKIDIGVENGFL